MVLQAATDPGETNSAQYGVIIEILGMTRTVFVNEDFRSNFHTMIEAYLCWCVSEWFVLWRHFSSIHIT